MRIKIAALILLASVSYAAAAGFGFVPGGYLLTGGAVLLESSDYLLLEDGSKLLLE